MPWGWKPYVPVAQRRAKAERLAQKLVKNGRALQPVKIEGRAMARTFWGQAWCENLEQYSDYANRLPRGRTYARNGSVIDLQISEGEVAALVSGSDIYRIKVSIAPLAKAQWKKIKADCAQSIPSLIDLLQGRFSQGVMERLTRPREGLFPQPREIKMQCSCPDWATLCKHVAAVLYGVGARLDHEPELLFKLRNVDHLELIDQAVDGTTLDAALASSETSALQGEDLEALFGIDLGGAGSGVSAKTGAKQARRPATLKAKTTNGPVTEKASGKSKSPRKTASAKKKATAGNASTKGKKPAKERGLKKVRSE
jgi:uncharacterized Zn finger protein